MKSFFIILIIPVLLIAQSNPFEIPLWETGAPGFESLKNEPQIAQDWWIKNIHNPTVTAYLPDSAKATGTAIVIAPGGGHKELVFNPEGRDAAQYLNRIGVAAFVLKYRLAREQGSKYRLEDHVKQDVYRAVRLVRNRAKEFSIDKNRIGIMGFSAGGELAALVAYDNGNINSRAKNNIDNEKARPDFQVLIYPGGAFIPDTIPSYAPPAFLVVAMDDPWCLDSSMEIFRKYKEAGLSIEAHFYARGAHAFNMGQRSTLRSINTWPQRLADWLLDSGYLDKEAE